MTEEPRNPSIDPALEARIVALVLGEASDFEQDELNRLIEERPELTAFRDELQSLHGLLMDVGAGESNPTDEEWKLPKEKREAVLAAFDGRTKPQAVLEPSLKRSQAHWSRSATLFRSVAKIAALLAVAAFVGSMAIPSVQMARRVSSVQSPSTAAMMVDDAPAEMGLEGSIAEFGFSGAGLESEGAPSSDSALSAIRESLARDSDANGRLPTPYYLHDDVQYFPSGPEFKLPQVAAETPQPQSAERYSRSSSGSASSSLETLTLPAFGESEIAKAERGESSRTWGTRPERRFQRNSGDMNLDFALGGQLPNPDIALYDVPSTTDGFTLEGREAGQGQVGGGSWQFRGDQDSKGDTALGVVVDPNTRSRQSTRGGEPLAAGNQAGQSEGQATLSFSTKDQDVSVESEALDVRGLSRDFRMQSGDDGLDQPAVDALMDDTMAEPPPAPMDGGGGFGGSRVARESSIDRFEVEEDFATEAESKTSAITPSQETLPPVVKDFEDRVVVENRERETAKGRMIVPSDESVVMSIDGVMTEELFEERSLELREKLESNLSGGVPLSGLTVQGRRRYLKSDSSQMKFSLGDASKELPRELQSDVTKYYESLVPNESDNDDKLQSLGRSIAAKEKAFRALTPEDGAQPRFEPKALAPAKKPVPSAGLNEKRAAEEAFSTFSLHVSDVSFKLARAALAGGSWPDPATIRIEEFVNAMDYGDPMPSQRERVACRVEQAVHPFLQQRNVLRVSMRTAALGRASTTPLRLTLLVDNSGSMERVDRQQTVRRAFALLAQQLQPMDQVTLISFARQPRLLADKVSGANSQQLVQIIDNLPSEGGTNMEAALQLAMEKAKEQFVENAQNRIILLTDGAVNLGNAEPESLSQMITKMRAAGIAFDAAGISADGLNDEVLEALARRGDGRYYLLDSLEDADDGFARQIAGALRPAAMNVKVQVEFNPKRVGRYKLLGFDKHRLNKEDFRNDQVDAAEMSAAEAGVAVYQFEAKPDGEGDIGSVSVRFRDVSTGQMVEHSWPIPYVADAPRLDQAAPAIRIATSAAMLAAKLGGEPLGEAVDLRTLANLMASLPDRDGAASRVTELQEMIARARELSGQ